MRLFTGEYGYAEYSSFNVSSETDEYKLSISGYTGNTCKYIRVPVCVL